MDGVIHIWGDLYVYNKLETRILANDRLVDPRRSLALADCRNYILHRSSSPGILDVPIIKVGHIVPT